MQCSRQTEMDRVGNDLLSVYAADLLVTYRLTFASGQHLDMTEMLLTGS